MRIDKIFEPGRPPYIIAEVGFNHGGDMDLARRMIAAAAGAGADAVKFQTFQAIDLALPGAEHFTQVACGELGEEQHRLLAAAASEAGVDFLSTPFSVQAVELLERVGVPAFKIASMDLTNFPLLARAAVTGKPLLVSTGMARVDEIRQTLDFLRARKAERVAFLHCVSKYPADASELNLDAVRRLSAELGVSVGYSDHHPGVKACLAAGMLGAAVIETHFTLDTAWPGGDHGHSADPSMLAELVRDLALFHGMRGSEGFFDQRPDRTAAALFRRGLYAACDLPAGHVIAAADLLTCRPVSELGPNDVADLVGLPLRREVKAFAPLKRGDFRSAA